MVDRRRSVIPSAAKDLGVEVPLLARDPSEDLRMTNQGVCHVSNRYLVVLEMDGNSYGASVPDLPGCVAVARTLPAAPHVEDMISRGQKPPKPRARVDYVDAKVA